MTQMAKPNILLVDDDKELTALLSDFLGKQGFDVTVCHDTQSVPKALAQAHFDALVLDAMLPDGSGFEVLESLRSSSSLPIIMLTALDADADRISGLELGADDYVPKPCNPRELVARLRAILRRSQRPLSDENLANLRIDHVELSWKERKVFSNQKPVVLTATQFDLLALLMRAAGNVVDKERLSQDLLGRTLGPFDRSIDMHVSTLRRKLGKASDGASPITTVRGSGYMFRRTGEA